MTIEKLFWKVIVLICSFLNYKLLHRSESFHVEILYF